MVGCTTGMPALCGDAQGSRTHRGDVSGELNPSKSKVPRASVDASRTSCSEAESTVLPVSLLGAKEAADALSGFRQSGSGNGSSGSVRHRRKPRLELCCSTPSKWMKVFFTGKALANSSTKAVIVMGLLLLGETQLLLSRK